MRAARTAAFGALLGAALALVAGGHSRAQAIGKPHVAAELIAGQAGVQPGGTLHVALRQVIEPGWHTYWRNPGDSGEATQIHWTLPPGWTAGDIVWPAPRRLPVGPLMNYGYEGEVLLPVPITAPASAKAGQNARLAAEVLILVCKDICIPQTASLTLDLPVTTGAGPHPRWGAPIARTLADAPKPSGLRAAYAIQAKALKLAVTGEPLRTADVSRAYFFPYEGSIIDHAGPQRVERGPDGLTLTLTPAEGLAAPPATIAGVLSLGAGRAYEVTAARGAFPPGAIGLGSSLAGGGGGGGGLRFPLALVFAFLGGVVLNAMPCVFPVLSMKAASLTGHAHEAAAARRQGLAFTAGVLAAFAALGLVLIAAKGAGAAAGWGFQLQNPAVVASLGLLMLLIALNLSGVFEVGMTVPAPDAGMASRSGLTGAFFTGALAVVIAAPCTAPFMAGALGYALTQSAPIGLAVFVTLGLGFAAPFLLLSLSPALLRRLPRPGPWMEVLRRLLAFPMYAAAGWLLWVLTLQAGTTALAALIAAGVALALAAWLFGLSQRDRLAGRRTGPQSGFAALAGLTAVAIAAFGLGAAASSAAPGGNGGASGLASEPFTPARLAELRAEGRPVLVNFTAAWCVTCQVNEQLALARKPVADAVARTGAAYLKADWTRRDGAIARELARHGRAGVPLYLVYPAGGAEPEVLPQLLTEVAVVAALERAAGPRTREAASMAPLRQSQG